jgi:membrane fusion protein (multidrug efflux system)
VVKKGDLLFVIDPRPFEAALAQAKAQVTQAEAQQARTEAEFQKQKELYDKKVVSQRDYDNALQMNLSNVAAVDVAKASLQQAQLSLEFTKIVAPVDGIASVANVSIGDLVGPSSGVLMTVSTVDPIKAKFPLSEQEYLTYAKAMTDAMAMPLGERQSRGELILANGQTFAEKGKFLSVDREVNIKTGTIGLEVLFPNPGNVLRPGQFARVRASLDTLPAALLVPQRAVAEMQGSYSLAVIAGDGKAEIRPVKVGERVGSEWIISEGLKAGEKVVVEGLQKVRAGAPVVARPWTPPAPPNAASAPDAAGAKSATESKPEAK